MARLNAKAERIEAEVEAERFKGTVGGGASRTERMETERKPNG